VQLQEIVQRAGFDQKFVDEITKKMEEAIEAKNSILRNLKYSLAHAQKVCFFLFYAFFEIELGL
jgi:growth arrest-specific protein 8